MTWKFLLYMPARIVGYVQNYDWGKTGRESLVADLAECGSHLSHVDPDRPYAELWLGSHPSGPCYVKEGDEHVPVSEWLSKRSLQLPYLLKVLSVGQALSIQSHPDALLARQLHAERPAIYRDPNPKPEVAIALTPMTALFGFRPVQEIQEFIRLLPPLQDLLTGSVHDSVSLKSAYSALLKSREQQVGEVITQIQQVISSQPELLPAQLSSLFLQLSASYPSDPGVLSVFFFRFCEIPPGSSIFVPPNTPHAYLSGDLIECMTGSDNVIRGGLTGKFKDVETLIESLDYSSSCSGLFKPTQGQAGSLSFRPVPDFGVSAVYITEPVTWKFQSVSIILVIQGTGFVGDLEVKRGESVIIQSGEELTMSGCMRLFLADSTWV